MRNLRQPFFGMPEDAALIGSMGDGTEFELPESAREFVEPGSPLAETLPKQPHPDCREKGTAIPLGFMPHQGENRATRRKASATWVPPKTTQKDAGAGGTPPAPDMPTRRELFEQRRKHQRGKLDPELRRLQHERLKQK